MRNRNLIYFTFLFFLLINTFSIPQSLMLGLRYEPGILFGEQGSENFTMPLIYSISGNVLFEPIELFNIEIRPGIILISEEYSGFELGMFGIIKMLPTRFYLLFGFNNHFNMETAHNRGGSYEKGIFYKGLGLGYRTGLNSFIDLTYLWTSDRNFAYIIVTDGLTYSRQVDKKVRGILKLGFNITWDIL